MPDIWGCAVRRFWDRIKRIIAGLLPLALYVALYKRKDPDKYEFIWKDGDYRVIIFDRKVYGVWYQARRRGKRK